MVVNATDDYTEDEYIQDTMKHINLVRRLLHEFSDELIQRAEIHDASKLVEPEKSIFRKHTKALDACEFGSDAYIQHKLKVRVALDHHYANNRHHPEYHEHGVADMNLIDIVEMFCDWTAASKKNNHGNVMDSIRVCQERFGFSYELMSIFMNTVKYVNQKA